MKTFKRGVRRFVKVFLPKIFNLFVILSLVFQPVGSAGVWDVVLAQSTDPDTDAVADVPADVPAVEIEEPTPAPVVETSEPAADEPVAEEPAPVEEATLVTEEETAPADTTLVPTPSIGDTGATTDIPSDSGEITPPSTEEEVPVVTNPEMPVLTEEIVPIETPTETPIDTSADTVETPAIEPAETSEENPTTDETPAEMTPAVPPAEEVPATLVEPVADEPVDETVCLAASVTGDSEGNWNVDEEKNIAVTNDPVQLGVRYVFPLDKEVTVTFTCLPKDEAKRAALKIERIKSSDINLPDGTVAVSEYAYDITTDGMENGTFKYDLTLPKFEGVKNADISYIEMSADEVISKELKKKDIKQVDDENIDNKVDIIEATDIDHFTIVFPSVNVVCQNDVNGVNDITGQKDLTMMCRNTDVATNIFTKWNWDDISWSGNNTGDACNLFDTDNDGDVNYAICVTIGGSPAVIQSTTRYSCGDDKPDRCTNPVTSLLVSQNTACEVSTSSTDPFTGGDAYPSDTQAICSIALADVGGSTSAKLIDVCSYPSQQPNSDPSDCIIATQAQTGKLEVIKDLIPSSDTGLFNLSIDGSVLATGVGDGGTTGEQVVLSANSHTFNEAGNGATSLSNYTTTVSCKDGNGTGSTIATTGSFPWTITVAKDKDIVCTITNTLKSGTITIVKDAVPNDAQDFAFTSDISTATSFSLDDDSDGTLSNTKIVNNLAAGTYSISETVPTGWTQTSATCSDQSPVSAISLQAGENITCTFTNTKAATLNVVKLVTNNNGGGKIAADFPLFVDGNPVTNNVANVFTPGLHTVTETQQTGYSLVSFTGDCDSQGQVTLNAGDAKTCAITNDDQVASLTVIKHVVNDNGGTKNAGDFTMNVTGTDVSNPSFAGSETGTVVTLDAGSYSVDEGSVFGYAKTLGTNCSGTIALGESKTCTVTNDDIQPTLTVIKIVNNGDGGNLQPSNFTINVTGTSVSPASFQGSAGQLVTLNAGNYNVTETLISGYVPQYSNDCTGSIAVGETKTCTITNDDQAPTLTLVKTVINDNSGTKVVGDFPLFINGNPVTSGVSVVLAANTQYTASETNQTGYAPSSWGGDCVTDGTITLLPGQNKTCTITNNDIQPKLTVTKVVVNDGFGTKIVSDFPLFVDNTSVTSGVQNGFNAGSYVVSETLQTGYTGVISGDCAANGSVTLAVGDVKACTITNNDALGKIIIEKQTLPDGNTQTFEFNPSWSADNFSLADGQQNTSPALSAGTYSVSEIVPIPSGWDQTSAICSDGSLVSEVSLQDGETVTCVFTNTKRGNIVIVKDAQPDSAQNFTFNNNFGNSNPSTFSLDDDSNVTLPKTRTFEVIPSTYTVSENAVSGWQQESQTCDSGETIDSIDVAAGETVTCTFVNEKYAKIKLVKNTIGGNDTFDFDATGADLSTDIDLTTVAGTATQTFSNLDQDNTYTIAENVPAGWDLTSATCTGTNTPAEITPNAGETVTCTFTNSKLPILTLQKTVVKDNGGTAADTDWTLSASGSTPISGVEGDVAITNAIVSPDTYTLSELNGPSGYLASAYSCVKNGGDAVVSNSITLAYGDVATCTITNDDIAPKLHLRKVIYGGDATLAEFTLTASGTDTNDLSGISPVDSDGTLKADTFALSETGPDGYTASAWSCEGGDQNDSNITLGINEEATCTITNTRDIGTIVIHKIIDVDGNTETTDDQTVGVGWEFDVTGTGDDTSNPDPGSTGIDGSVTFADLNTGQYSVTETPQSGYDLVSIVCNVKNGPWLGNTVSEIPVSKDATTECTFYNSPNGTIHGYKWSDENGDGEVGEGEEKLAGWRIFIDEDGDETFDEGETFMDTSDGSEHFGWYWFEHLFPGTYSICEVEQTGWNQTYPANCHTITLPEGQSTCDFQDLPNSVITNQTCNFGNQFIPPQLKIEKFVGSEPNTSLAGQNPGDTVTYILKIKAAGGDNGEIANQSNVNDVVVTDLLPAGFTFDSTVSVSSSDGSHILAQSPSSPYASPGKWSLGTMQPGEVITIQYNAVIGGSQDAGTYKDLAWAQGRSDISETPDVIATFGDPELFVGTEVEVVLPVAPANVELVNIVEREVDTKTIHKTKRVLGAATVLPSTGSNINTILFALLLLIGGLILMLLGKRSTWLLIKSLSKSMSKAVKISLFVIIGILSVSHSASAASGDLNVQIEQPKAVINNPEIKVGFVVLDISADDTIDISCQISFEAGPFIEFDAINNLIKGGTSGDCDVDVTDMPTDGTYTFRVVATEDTTGDTDTATATSIELISGTPSTPLNYSRADGSCTASFTTANDGLTDKVELYRSLSSTFTADGSTFVQDVAIAPNTGGTITDPNGDCGGSYFYATRAVAASSLESGFVGDESVTVDNENKIETKTTTKRLAGPVTTLGAIPVTGGGESAGVVEGVATGGEEITQPSTEQQGEVLGEATSEKAEEAGGLWNWIKSHPWWSLLWLLVIFLIAYFVRRIYFGNYNENNQPR